APPPDPRMLERLDGQLVVLGHERSGLVDVLPTDENTPRHDQRLRLRAGVDEPALDEGDVEALLFHALRRVKPSWAKWRSLVRTVEMPRRSIRLIDAQSISEYSLSSRRSYNVNASSNRSRVSGATLNCLLRSTSRTNAATCLRHRSP